jgi:hypothetical protein
MPAMITKTLRRLALAAPVLLAAAPVAWAQPAAQPRPSVSLPLQDLPDADSFTERAERMWDSVVGLFRFRDTASYYMHRNSTLDRGHARARDDLTAMMDVAGYKLKEIESTVSLLPSLQMTFGQARELTDSDREYVERFLDRHALRNPGPLAALQRMIVRSVLEASDLNGLAVEKVEIDMFPLPKVKVVVAPSDAPLGLDAARIMRSIETLNRRLQQMSNRSSGFEVPEVVPGPGLRTTAQPSL